MVHQLHLLLPVKTHLTTCQARQASPLASPQATLLPPRRFQHESFRLALLVAGGNLIEPGSQPGLHVQMGWVL